MENLTIQNFLDIPDHIQELLVAMAELLTVVEAFPPESRELILFDQWSLKDMLSHFSGWNVLTIAELTKLQQGLEVENWVTDDQLDEFNRQSVEARRGWTWEEVYAEFLRTCVQLTAKYYELNPDEWYTQFGPSENDIPLNSLQIDIEHFGKTHLPDIKQQLATLK